jgi:hypothetical protein
MSWEKINKRAELDRSDHKSSDTLTCTQLQWEDKLKPFLFVLAFSN